MDRGEADGDELARLVDRVPEGWTRVVHGGRPWGLTRVTRAGGRAVTLDAVELGGRGRLGANVWRTAGGDLLRPCEVPAADVLDLLRDWTTPR